MAGKLELEIFQLQNGLTLIIHQNQRLPLVSLCGFVGAGKDQNPVQLPGCAALTSGLLDEGTENLNATTISQKLETVGGELSAISEREFTGFCFRFGADHYRSGLELMAEMLIRPTFPINRFEIERAKVRNHIRAMEDDPETVGSQLLNWEIYKPSPLAYPILGTQESIELITPEDLRSFYQHKYAPSNTCIIAVGDVEPEVVLPMVEDLFGDWSNSNLQLKEIDVPGRQTEPLTVRKPMDKQQVTAYVGHLGIQRKNPDFYSVQLLDIIMGGGPGFTSRIPRRIRDEAGLVYSIYADLSGSSGKYPGRFTAYLNTDPSSYRRALALLRKEVEILLENGVSEDELAVAKEFLIGNFSFEFESNLSITRYLLAMELYSLEPDFSIRYPKLIRSTDREDILRVARQYLDTVNYFTIIVGSV